MNKIVSWMIALLIIFVAFLSPAKGKTVDGVVNPSTTLTIKSLIEAEHGEKTVVCPPAVHKNIKRLTPCAMGYRAVVGRNRVIITHMWPARTVEEFHRRTGLKSNDVLQSPEVALQVVKELEKAKAEAKVEKTRADALQSKVEVLRVEKEKLEKLINKLEADKIALEQQVSTLKEEGGKMAEQLRLATNTVKLLEEQQTQVAAQSQVVPTTPVTTSAEHDDEIMSQEKSGFWYWSIVTVVLLIIIFHRPIIEKMKDRTSWWWKDDCDDDLFGEGEVVTRQDPTPSTQKPDNFPKKPAPLMPYVSMTGGPRVLMTRSTPAARPIPITPAPVSSDRPDPDATMVFPPVNSSGGGTSDGGIDSEPPPQSSS